MTTLLLLLAPLAMATGIAMPAQYLLVDEACEAVETSDWPLERPIRVTGFQQTFTSPPGGPVAEHREVLHGSRLYLRRADCALPTLEGAWEADGECGGDSAWGWRSSVPLEEGATYEVLEDRYALLSFATTGSAELSSCPPELPPVRREEQQPPEIHHLILPAEAVQREGGTVALDRDAVLTELGLEAGQGWLWREARGKPGPQPSATARVTRRRLTRDVRVGHWGWRCEAHTEVSVVVEIDGVEAVYSMGVVEDPWGSEERCPRE